VNDEGFIIRPFRLEDQPEVESLILSGLGEHFGDIDPDLNPDLADIAANYGEAGNAFFVADAAGQLAGTGGLVRESAEIGRIVRVSVAPEKRRRGIGRAMVGRLLWHAQEIGLHTLLVETNLDWHEAISLYLAHGFREYDRDEESVHLRRRI
jgi:N-acetylglutamate synthase-like GNAT family acetyltransferase